ncbi:energy transducer TonB [Perlabentimonas gracilis]|uniref:energy transducer TonB n=1 Tax=Perlabentimonas gracilis TaxID=2715279 RepID=UPI00140AFA49|nr:energy transducer TonB [Perlabentimonas gracilis]NHB67898.1 energy transducer TonB [Perlabentimonas gracilis]
MELKKNPKVDLQKKKTIFLEIGLVLSLLFILAAFEWTSTGGINTDLAQMQDIVVEEEMIPITQQEEIKPPPPPPQPQQVIELINIVEDDVDLDDDVDLFDMEFNEDVAVQIINFVDDEDEFEEEEIFVIVEDMPSFQGGDINKFREYINRNLKYPEIAAENGIQGRVILSFVVEPAGNVSNVRILRGVDPALDREAIRVVESSPKWKPGMQRGKPVRVSFNIPIIFVLQ